MRKMITFLQPRRGQICIVMAIFILDSYYRSLYMRLGLYSVALVFVVHVCMRHATVKSHSSFETSNRTTRL